MSENTSIDQLADAADRIFSQLDNQTMPVHSAEATRDHSSLEKTVEDLQRQWSKPVPFPPALQKSTTLVKSEQGCPPTMCYYHRRYGRLFYVTDTRNNLRFWLTPALPLVSYPCVRKARKQPSSSAYKQQMVPVLILTVRSPLPKHRDATRLYLNFTVADVQMPILGADFLAHYDLAVRMNDHSLTDNLTRLCVLGTYSKLTTTGITVATCHSKEYLDLLNQYQDLLRPTGSIDSTKHQTQHFIKTTGQPVFSRPRRLAPNKLKFAKKAFDDMLREGVIRPSDSPYASPLHLVPKPGKEDYRICVDYRRLNSITVRDRYPIPHLHDFTSAVTTPPVSSSFIQDLRLKMANLCYTPPRHCPSDIYLPHQLKDCEFVFVRNDSVKRALRRPTQAHTAFLNARTNISKYRKVFTPTTFQ
ncbi:unnamed protein product [Acanthosepion pharaonis]|uniref:Gag-pol polyprotein n=1 Tax=Acanthosepion pharaonis TaxID=158019 RepID=A0A812E6A3_ACAPH|nr:unnamed protein product [Sepia pharaonis]